MTSLALPEVTLCAVDTRSPALALRAMRHSMRGLGFARALLLTHGAPPVPAGIECVEIGVIESSAAYSDFMLRRLAEHVDTSHVLVIQWDGFVVDPSRWDASFLRVDYLGAPWGKAPHGHVVGNGGFSLRSRRLLLALRDPAFAPRLHHPEDLCIGQTLRPALESEHGIVFGDLALARRFAFENEPPAEPTFGFHGAVNLPRMLPASELAALVDELPPDVAAGRDGFKLSRALLRAGHVKAARQLLTRRLASGATDWRTRWLAWQARASAAEAR